MEKVMWMGEEVDVIHKITRADLIGDGFLIDVTQEFKEATNGSFRVPIAISAGVNGVVMGDDITENEFGEIEPFETYRDRLWAIALELICTIKGADPMADRVYFTYEDFTKDEKVEMYAVMGPGDQGEPVMTVMLIHED